MISWRSFRMVRRFASAGGAPGTKWWLRKAPNASKVTGGANTAAGQRAIISGSRTKRAFASGCFAPASIAISHAGAHAGSCTECMPDMTRYLEFAVASNFSFLRGASHPEELMLQAAEIGLLGIGLCDRNSVAGVVRAHVLKREKKLALAYHPGARLVFADGTPDILAYPRDRPAWGRLCRLLTRGNLRAKKGDCLLYLDDLLELIDGLELIVMERSSFDAASASSLRTSQQPSAGPPELPS